MIEKLEQIGFKRIAIVDDSQENLFAAKQLEKRFPEIQFEFYEKGSELIAKIPQIYADLSLVLTDLQMETADIGLDVLEIAWRYHVPAYICTGGKNAHDNLPRVNITPSLINFHLPDNLLKNNPDTWYAILEGIVQNAFDKHSLLHMELKLKNENQFMQNTFAKYIRQIAFGELYCTQF